MRSVGRILLLFLAILGIFVFITEGAIAGESGTYTNNIDGEYKTINWTLDDEGVLTFVGEGPIPDTDFRNSDLEWAKDVRKIIVKEGITRIGNFSFQSYPNLMSITIPDSVTMIGDRAFYECPNIQEIHVASLESWMSISTEGIESRPNYHGTQFNLFVGDQEVNKLEIPQCIGYIDGGLFRGCISLISVSIPYSINEIGSNAFAECINLQRITMPHGITSIGEKAFYNCSKLESVNIPDTVTSIGISAFEGCISLSEVLIPEGVTAIENSTFKGCLNLARISIPSTIGVIRTYAFKGCNSILSVQLPDDLSAIEYGAFYDCANLSEIVLPQQVMSIGSYAFYNCSSLESINIPDRVTMICDYAFSNCSSMSHVQFSNNITIIGNYAFSGCSSLSDIILPNELQDIQYGAFENCESITSVQFPESLKKIRSNAFFGCRLSSVNLPENVEEIEMYAFEYNIKIYAGVKSNLAKVLSKGRYKFRDAEHDDYDLIYELGANGPLSDLVLGNADTKEVIHIIPEVTIIADSAFKGMTQLKEIEIPSGVTSIGSYAFSGCTSLRSINIPEAVISIGYNAFSGCTSLRSINIPESVDIIRSNTFADCASLTSIIIPSSVTQIQENAFNGCERITDIIIPNGVTVIGRSAFARCYNLKSIVIPKSVVFIEEGAFSGCSRLKSLNLPEGLYRIEKYVFENCGSLSSLVIPDSVKIIGERAFMGCGLNSITIPSSVEKISQSAFASCAGLDIVCFLHSPDDSLEVGFPGFNDTVMIYCYEFSNAEIWANDNGYNVTLLDGLNLNSVRSISIQADSRIPLGSEYIIGFNVFPSHDNPSLIWSSSNTSVATVESGVVTPHKKGTVTISVLVGSVTKTVTLEIYVPTEEFEIDKTEEWLIAKNTIKLNIINIQPNGAEPTITWSSSDTLYATVDNEGLVTTKKTGTVIISADSENGIHRECKLIICYRVSSIVFESPEISIIPFEEYQAKAIVSLSDQTVENRFIKFSSSNPEIATVDDHGMVRGLKEGRAVITASADTAYPASMTVLVREALILQLPSNLTRVEAEAFAGSACEVVIIPNTCSSIGDRAFANCKRLIRVIMPNKNIKIAENAFEGCNEKLALEN